MELQSGQSEAACILQQIEMEYVADRCGLTSFEQSAKQTAITLRMEHVGLLHKDLQAIAGDDAIRLIAERLSHTKREVSGHIRFMVRDFYSAKTWRALSAGSTNVCRKSVV